MEDKIRQTTQLRSIEIENFRGIKYCKLDNLTDINIFIGKNVSGKSTILESIYLASASVIEYDIISGKPKIQVLAERRTLRGIWDKVKEWFWYASDITRNIRIVLRVKFYDYSFILSYKDNSVKMRHSSSVPYVESIKTKEYLKSVILIDDQLIKNPQNIEEKNHTYRF